MIKIVTRLPTYAIDHAADDDQMVSLVYRLPWLRANLSGLIEKAIAGSQERSVVTAECFLYETES